METKKLDKKLHFKVLKIKKEKQKLLWIIGFCCSIERNFAILVAMVSV